MAKFHFFTDIDLINQQPNSQAFGPVIGNEATQYRVTSLHTASSNPNAYAVCKGDILVQPDINNTNLVNVILRPALQPNNIPQIKYYIYRGILKNSLIDGNNVADSINKLTKSIPANTDKKTLGIDLFGTTNFENTDPIDNAFTKSKTGFELWHCDSGGWSIGTFDKNNFGFEIMLEDMGFNPTFDIIRNNNNVIQINALTGSETPAQIFEHWHDKEEILNYLDPAVFYGNFYDDIIYARKSTDSIDSDLNPSFSKEKNNGIYTNILLGNSQGNFFNRNKIYLDIRNELNYSINYFKNYGNNIKISYLNNNSEPINEINYYENNWPLCVLSDLPNGNEKNTIKIALPKGDNTLPLSYVSIGERKLTNKEKVKYGKTNFIDLEVVDNEIYTTNSIAINTPNYNDNDKTRICSYIKIKYLKRFDLKAIVPKSEGSVLRAAHYLDHLFIPLEMNLTSPSTNVLKIKMYNNDNYIDTLKEFGLDYIANIGIASDIGHHVFFASIKDVRTKNRSVAKNKILSISSGTRPLIDNFLNTIFPNASFIFETISDNGESIKIYRYPTAKKSFFTQPNKIDYNKEIIVIMLSNDNYTSILNIAQQQFSSKYKVYLGVENNVEDNYERFDLVLRGLIEENDQITVKKVSVSDNSNNPVEIYGYLPEPLI